MGTLDGSAAKYEPEEREALSRRAGRLSPGQTRVIPCPRPDCGGSVKVLGRAGPLGVSRAVLDFQCDSCGGRAGLEAP
jgi:hypothetical protein